MVSNTTKAIIFAVPTKMLLLFSANVHTILRQLFESKHSEDASAVYYCATHAGL